MNPFERPSERASTWSRSAGQYTTLRSIGGISGSLVETARPGPRAQSVASDSEFEIDGMVGPSHFRLGAIARLRSARWPAAGAGATAEMNAGAPGARTAEAAVALLATRVSGARQSRVTMPE